MLHNFLYVVLGLLALVALISIGFAIPPRPFRPHPAPSQPGEPQPLRPGLPEPVRRHFVETIGETPRTVKTAVVWGRGRRHIRGVWVPLRFKAWYRPGEAYTRRMEVTWFQRPVMRGRDAWKNGTGFYEMGDKVEQGEEIDQSQALAMWADAVWMPSLLVHESPIGWDPVDENMARLVIPDGRGGSQSLLAYFDPINGRMTHLSGKRYSISTGEQEPWRVDLLTWKQLNGLLIPDQTSVAWGESGSPLSYWSVDGVAYNVNVTDQLG